MPDPANIKNEFLPAQNVLLMDARDKLNFFQLSLSPLDPAYREVDEIILMIEDLLGIEQ